MALKIRLARGGSKKHPFYRIVVAEASSPRDGRFVERLGSYDPMVPKDHENRVSLKDERIKFWMSKGAKPTLRVHKILAAAGLLDAPIIREQPIKAAPGKKRLERENEAKEAAEAPAPAKQHQLQSKKHLLRKHQRKKHQRKQHQLQRHQRKKHLQKHQLKRHQRKHPAEAPAAEAPAEEAPAEAPPAETPAEAPAAEAPAEEAPAEAPAEAEEEAETSSRSTSGNTSWRSIR